MSIPTLASICVRRLAGLVHLGMAAPRHEPSPVCQPVSHSLCRLRALAVPPHEVVRLPALRGRTEVGHFVSMNMSEGDELVAGKEICSGWLFDPDFAFTFACQDDWPGGFIAKILLEPGLEEVPVGTPLMVTVMEKQDVADFADFSLATAAPEHVSAAVAASTATQAATPIASAVVGGAWWGNKKFDLE